MCGDGCKERGAGAVSLSQNMAFMPMFLGTGTSPLVCEAEKEKKSSGPQANSQVIFKGVAPSTQNQHACLEQYDECPSASP